MLVFEKYFISSRILSNNEWQWIFHSRNSPEVVETVLTATLDLFPKKSRKRYEYAYVKWFYGISQEHKYDLLFRKRCNGIASGIQRSKL